MRAHTPFFRILLVLAALAAVPRWAMTQETTGAAEGRDDAVLRQTARGPAADRVDAAALERLLDEAARTHSDALVVLLDGELVGAWYSAAGPRRIESMSVTKSIVNLAVGRLVTLGRIPSVDVPVSAFYPEWNTGRKAKVTLRHLMNHTSGIAAKQSTAEIYASDDFVRLALDAEITSEPGTVFFYNNKAVNLIAGIVEKSAGKRMDLSFATTSSRTSGSPTSAGRSTAPGIPRPWRGSRSGPRTWPGSGSSSSSVVSGTASN